MREVFERAFGLMDNPFNPLEFSGVDSQLLDDLSTRALQIDKAPELLPLFVPGAGPFETILGRFAELLELSGYHSGPEQRLGKKSFFFRIIGPQGSGKSTLTNAMINWLTNCLPDRGLFVQKQSLRNPDRVAVQLAAATEEIIDRGAKWCCLAFDDVSGSVEPALLDLYRELQDEANIHIVLFAIMHQAEDVRRPKLSAPVPIHEYRTTGLASDHAERFVARRVELFRCEGARGLLRDDLAVFPFDLEDIALAVSPRQSSANGGDPGSITLRTLNQILHRGLERAVLASPADLQGLAPDDLRAARVKVLEMFAEEIRAAA